jgi:hypothetical protein
MIAKPRRLQPRQVTQALGGDRDQPATPARLLRFELQFNYRDAAAPQHSWLLVGYLGDADAEVELSTDDPRRLAEVLRRDDLTYLDGAVLLLVNEHHGVMGVATGPPVATGRLYAPTVTSLDGGAVVEALGGADNIAWQVFAISRAEPSGDVPAPEAEPTDP